MALKKKIIIYIIMLISSIVILTFAFWAIDIFCKYNPGEEVRITLTSDYVDHISRSDFQKRKHVSILSEYIADNSIGYLNRDGSKTIYIYAIPIHYFNSNSNQWVPIDTRIRNVSDKAMRESGYIYTIADSDIKSFYPRMISSEQGILLQHDFEYSFGVRPSKTIGAEYVKKENFIGDEKNMVSYSGVFGDGTQFNLSPSLLGTNCEIHFSEKPKDSYIEFWISVPKNVYLRKEPGGYAVMTQNIADENGRISEQIVGIIQSPIQKNQNKTYSYRGSLDIEKEDNGQYTLKVNLDMASASRDMTIYLSFEMRKEKQSDNTIYSQIPNLKNAYLCNYALVGNNQEKGIGRMMIRYFFTHKVKLGSFRIQNASYKIYAFPNAPDKLLLSPIMEEWCSMLGNWNSHYAIGEAVSEIEISAPGEIQFGITEEVRKWYADPLRITEQYGLMLQSNSEMEGRYSIILTGDNALYNNHVEMTIVGKE